MNIEILGAESLGVRGLCCSVDLGNRKVLIDPGIALGWSRHGFLPHPFQVAVGVEIRRRIIAELGDATDVVFSHFHGDHCPLPNANPYQLALEETTAALSACRIWAKSANRCSAAQQHRRRALAEALGRDLPSAEGINDGPLEFSSAVPHGQQTGHDNTVMMSRIAGERGRFVHASDIQLLDAATIETILRWEPNIVLASGPPLYRFAASSSQALAADAWDHALALARNVDAVIIDHHVLRSQEGVTWLEALKRAAPGSVYCAADFMERQPLLLEAWRTQLYEWLSVPEDWHELYARGRASLDDYRRLGWETLISHGKLKPCRR